MRDQVTGDNPFSEGKRCEHKSLNEYNHIIRYWRIFNHVKKNRHSPHDYDKMRNETGTHNSNGSGTTTPISSMQSTLGLLYQVQRTAFRFLGVCVETSSRGPKLRQRAMQC